MCGRSGVNLVCLDVAEGSVGGETSLVPEIASDTTPVMCIGSPERDEEEDVEAEEKNLAQPTPCARQTRHPNHFHPIST